MQGLYVLMLQWYFTYSRWTDILVVKAEDYFANTQVVASQVLAHAHPNPSRRKSAQQFVDEQVSQIRAGNADDLEDRLSGENQQSATLNHHMRSGVCKVVQIFVPQAKTKVAHLP